MIRRKMAAEVLGLLQEIEQALARYYEGEEPDTVIARLDEQIGELRAALWHEMPREVALRMDEEDGLPAGRGAWP